MISSRLRHKSGGFPALPTTPGSQSCSRSSVARPVCFEGRRDEDHRHPERATNVQLLETEEKEYEIGAGSLVFIPAGECHWHGAGSDSPGETQQ